MPQGGQDTRYTAVSLLNVVFWDGIPKKVTQIRTISAIDRLLAANIVEQNIGQHLSEPEFHAESNNSSLIPPNLA